MAWFDREHPSNPAVSSARFRDVSAPGRRLPSWISGHKHRARERESVPAAVEQPAPSAAASPEISAHPPGEAQAKAPQARSRNPSQSPSRISMSPSELESRIAAQAAQRTTQQFYEQAISGLAEALESLDQARRDFVYQAEPRLIELAVLIAKRVIAGEVRANPEIVADLVREGVDALAARDRVRVNLGSGFALASTLVTEQLVARGIEVDLQVIPGMPEYGCVVETDIGRVDEGIEARLDTLLASIHQESEG